MKRVLIVDDQEPPAEVAAMMFEELSYDPVVVHSAEDALEMLNRDNEFNLVFSDIVMPGMTGLELAREIKARWPDLNVLLTTGFSPSGQRAITLPILPKPYAFEQLKEAIALAA